MGISSRQVAREESLKREASITHLNQSSSVASAFNAVEPIDQGRKPLSTASVGAVYRAWRQASPHRPGDADWADTAVTMLQLAGCLGGSSAANVDPLAPSGMEVLLSPVVSITRPPDPDPFAPVPLRTFIATTGRSAPVLCIGTLASRFSPLGLLPWHQNDWFLQFHAIASIRFTPPKRRSSSVQSSGT